MSSAYNFTSPGSGLYTIEPSNLVRIRINFCAHSSLTQLSLQFTYIDASGTPVNIHATNEATEVKISGALSASRKQKRATFASCSSSQQTKLNAAATNAKTYAANTYKYVNGISAATPRFTTWFGKRNLFLTFPRHILIAAV